MRKDELYERLAAIEHERWADWQRWMHAQCFIKEDGSLVIPAELVERWERQIDTPYADLTEREKQSDRDQVNRYWSLIEPLLLVTEDPYDAGRYPSPVIDRKTERELWGTSDE